MQGVGYLNELIARLTGLPVEDETQTNEQDVGCVRGDIPAEWHSVRRFLARDNQMIAIFAQSSPLDPSSPDNTRRWRADRLVPFSARMVTEELVCEEAESCEGVDW